MIKVETKFNKKLVNNLYKAQLMKTLPLFILLSILFIGMGLLFMLKTDLELMGYGIALLCFGVLYSPIILLINFLGERKVCKSPMISDNTSLTFEFNNDGVEIHQFQEGVVDQGGHLDYNAFINGRENKENFFLFVNRSSCHVVPKEDITQGTEEQLRDLLKNQMGKKFKTKF